MAHPGEHLGWLVPVDIADKVHFEEYCRNHRSTPRLGSLPLLDEVTRISDHADDNSPLTPEGLADEPDDDIALPIYEDMLFARWSKTIIKTYIEAVKSLFSCQSFRLLLSSISLGQVQPSLSPSHRPSQRTYGYTI